MAAASNVFSGGGSCGGLCMTEFEFLENCLKIHEGMTESLVTKFLKGRGKPKNPCAMTEEVSFSFKVVKSLINVQETNNRSVRIYVKTVFVNSDRRKSADLKISGTTKFDFSDFPFINIGQNQNSNSKDISKF